MREYHGYTNMLQNCMTDKYDPNNKDHVRIKEVIEVGNGLPTLVHYSDIIQNLKDSGFEVLDSYDTNREVHASNEIPWYDTLSGTSYPKLY